MKTIEEASIEYAVSKYSSDVFIESHIKDFKAGVEFAQQFYIIDRDQYAEIDLEQKEELELNMPIFCYLSL